MEEVRNTIQSMFANNKACWDMIDEMGGDTSKPHNLQNMAEAILSIPTIFKPDLSKPLDKEQLDNLQRIVSAGRQAEFLNPGDTLLVNYGSYIMPFEIVGFEDIEVEGSETKSAINLLAKYTDEKGSLWASITNAKYSSSTLRAYIIDTYQGKLNADFVGTLAKTKTQTYSQDGSTDIVYDRLFAPSMSQLGVTDATATTAQQTTIEGPVFATYKGAASSKRIKQAINATSTAQYYWTRSWCTSTANTFGDILTSGAPSSSNGNITVRAVVACNLIGKN